MLSPRRTAVGARRAADPPAPRGEPPGRGPHGAARAGRAAARPRADSLDRLAATEHPQITAILARWPLRELVTRSRPLTVQTDRERALYGSWYEFFPRSEGWSRVREAGSLSRSRMPPTARSTTRVRRRMSWHCSKTNRV